MGPAQAQVAQGSALATLFIQTFQQERKFGEECADTSMSASASASTGASVTSFTAAVSMSATCGSSSSGSGGLSQAEATKLALKN